MEAGTRELRWDAEELFAIGGAVEELWLCREMVKDELKGVQWVDGDGWGDS